MNHACLSVKFTCDVSILALITRHLKPFCHSLQKLVETGVVYLYSGSCVFQYLFPFL